MPKEVRQFVGTFELCWVSCRNRQKLKLLREVSGILKQKFDSFNTKVDRIDELFYDALNTKDKEEFGKLWALIKRMLILS